MFQERLKSELSELRTKVLNIRDIKTMSTENLETIVDAVKNLQSIVLEIVTEQASRTERPITDQAIVEPEVLGHVVTKSS
jgi:hypothetical protein